MLAICQIRESPSGLSMPRFRQAKLLRRMRTPAPFLIHGRSHKPQYLFQGDVQMPQSMSPLYKKISRRLVPFLMLLYLIAFLDRSNISFAKLTMNHDLNIGDDLFGLAAGIFFLGYFLFEVPSNLALQRVGARRWIMILMIIWGIVSVCTAFVPGTRTYLVLRFLLGSAEAGFYPGVILYLTFWLPPSVRSSVMAWFVTGIPLSSLIGAPVSNAILLHVHSSGLHGWQWLFILEGSPAILLGALVFFLLPDRPQDVHWLSAEEKQTLQNDLQASAKHASHPSLLNAMRAQISVLYWSLAYFFLMLGLYGLSFWIPTVLKSHGMSPESLGWATALPYLAAIVGMILWSRSSDRRRERRFHLTAAYLTAAAGFLVAAFAPVSAIAIAGFALGAIGVLSAMPVFWSTSTMKLAGPLVAAHIAIINSIGNLGGFFGPTVMGWLHKVTSNYVAGLSSVAVFLTLGAFTVALLAKPSELPIESPAITRS
jgi:ACS family tartrate transporter-like MFS transporter